MGQRKSRPLDDYFNIPLGKSLELKTTTHVDGMDMVFNFTIKIVGNTDDWKQRIVTMAQSVIAQPPLPPSCNMQGEVVLKLGSSVQETKYDGTTVELFPFGRQARLVKGQTWDVITGQDRLRYKVMGIGELEVAGQVFKDVLTIQQINGLQTTESFYAPGWGMVQITSRGIISMDMVVQKLS